MAQIKIFNFKSYQCQNWVTLIAFLIAICFAIFSVYYFIELAPDNLRAFRANPIVQLILGCWIFLPPAWFFFEYYILWPNASVKKKEALRDARQLAQPFWAAVLLSLLFLVSK